MADDRCTVVTAGRCVLVWEGARARRAWYGQGQGYVPAEWFMREVIRQAYRGARAPFPERCAVTPALTRCARSHAWAWERGQA